MTAAVAQKPFALNPREEMIPIQNVDDLRQFAGKIVAYVNAPYCFGNDEDAAGYTTEGNVRYAFIAPQERPTAEEVIDTTQQPATRTIVQHPVKPSKWYVMHRLVLPSYRGWYDPGVRDRCPGNPFIDNPVLKTAALAMRVLSPVELTQLKSEVLPSRSRETPYFYTDMRCEYSQEEMFLPDNVKCTQGTLILGPFDAATSFGNSWNYYEQQEALQRYHRLEMDAIAAKQKPAENTDKT